MTKQHENQNQNNFRADEQNFLPAEASCNHNVTGNVERKVISRWSDVICCALFGMGTWLPVNTVYSQIPYLTQSAPESWSLSSYVVVVIQLANIIPILYYYNREKLAPHNATLICILLVVSTFSLAASAFTHQITVDAFGRKYSLYFYIFLFSIATESCISSLLFLPFMNRLPEQYLAIFFIGEGLSATVPGALALFQSTVQINDCASPISTKIIFLTGAFFMSLSMYSFFYLNKRAENDDPSGKTKTVPKSDADDPRSYFFTLLAIQAIFSCFHYGVVSGLQSYSCLPYGKTIYHLSVNINKILESVTMYLLSRTNLMSTKRLAIICPIQVCCIGYQAATAFMSPNPPFVGTTFGSFHIIIIWMLESIMSSYIKLSIASIFRHKRARYLFYYGTTTQAGAATGALCTFVLINYTNLLRSIPSGSCTP